MESNLSILNSYIKDLNEQLSKKILKLDKLNKDGLLYCIKEKKLKKELVKFLCTLLKDDAARTLLITNNYIDKIVYRVSSNSGWSIGPSYCCYIDKMYLSGQIYEYILKVIREDDGYYVFETDNEFVKLNQISFYNQNEEDLNTLHKLYTIRENIIKDIDNQIKDKNNTFTALAIGFYLGYGDKKHNNCKVKKLNK